MMKLLSVLVLAACVATPAAAASAKKKKLRMYQQGYHQQEPGWRHSQNRWDVISPSGRFIGRDPDPNVRQRLRDEDMFFRNRN